jgi:hypothetical protein
VSETWEDQQSRLVLMADQKDSKWDLSVNDRAAIRAALARLDSQAELVEEVGRVMPLVCQLLDGWHQDGTAWTEHDIQVRLEAGYLLAAGEAARRAILPSEPAKPETPLCPRCSRRFNPAYGCMCEEPLTPKETVGEKPARATAWQGEGKP